MVRFAPQVGATLPTLCISVIAYRMLARATRG
jgi:hypothetical protein